MSHIPVLLDEAIDALNLQPSARIIDATFGGGGHTQAILDRSDCFVCGIDRDLDAQKRAKIFEEKYENKFAFAFGKFSQIHELLNQSEKFDGILFDFGVSSFQIDDPERGFSFSKDGLLDMRMSRHDKISAYDVVNSFSEEDLAKIIWAYGDERNSRRIAFQIISMREKGDIQTTSQLRSAVLAAYYGMKKPGKIDVATKTFQALRIYVNNELAEIDAALKNSFSVLNDGARIVTISFHSLEDRVVKNWSKDFSRSVSQANKNVVKPSQDELSRNPRSRSAVLRSFVYKKT